MLKLHYASMCDDLTRFVSCIFELVIAVTSSKQWPIFSYTTIFGSEPARTGEFLECFFYKSASYMISGFYQKK